MKAKILSVVLVFGAIFGLYGEYAKTWQGEGAVASVHPLATQAGIDAFARGGNAIDAALATAFTLGVVDGHNSGIGGGCFILIRTSSGDVYAIDGREKAPLLAHKDLYSVDGEICSNLSKTGSLSIGVPGSVAAFDYLQTQFGKLKFSDVLLPAAKIAEEGFKIDRNYARKNLATLSDLLKFPASADIFTNHGKSYLEGELIVQKDLARTYRKLAAQGASYFYKGEFADKASSWIADSGGIISKLDFENYNIVIRQPIHSTYRGYDVYGFPPPSSGGVHVAQILNILEHLDFEDEAVGLREHYLVEAMKLAFADRAFWLGDSDFVDVPRGLIDSAYAAGLARRIQKDVALKVDSHGHPPRHMDDLFDKHTTHLATADRNGNWVSITTTLNTSFGSKVTIPGTGVLMNNQMDDFSAAPGVPNYFGLIGSEANSIEAGKRPLSSMSPTIVIKEGVPVLTVGAAGGPTIITQVLQTILPFIDETLPVEQCLQRPRLHHQWLPTEVLVEPEMSARIQDELESKGHMLKAWTGGGATQAIALENGNLKPVTDPRVMK